MTATPLMRIALALVLTTGVAAAVGAQTASPGRPFDTAAPPRAPGPAAGHEPGAIPHVQFSRRDVIDAPRVDFVRAADLDGDQDPDFLAVSSDTDDIEWWENNGDGSSFAYHAITLNSAQVDVVTPGDLDGDGDQDFLTLAPSRNRVGAWLNDGAGNFTKLEGFSPTVLNVAYIEAADITGDGRADFFAVLDSPSGIDWYENRGGLVPPGTAPPLEFNRFRVANSAAAGDVARVDAADIDLDGLIDFASAERNVTGDPEDRPYDGRINWWRQSQDPGGDRSWGKFRPRGYPQQENTDVAVGDADADGRPDLFALRSGFAGPRPDHYGVYLWLADPRGALTREAAALSQSPGNPADTKWDSLDAADVNGDGAIDFIVSEIQGQLCWYENPAGPAPTMTPTSTSNRPDTPTPTPPKGSTATPSPSATPGDATATPTPGTPTPPNGTLTLTPAATTTPGVTSVSSPTPAPVYVNYLPLVPQGG